MNKSDLKNGMIYKIRNGYSFYIILNRVHRLNDKNNPDIGALDDILEYYYDDLTHKENRWNDIMIIKDVNGKLLWKREEIDWTRIPVDTKILVRDSDNKEWNRRYFAKYKNGKVYTFMNNGTSWNTTLMKMWEQAKLEEPSEKVTLEELHKEFMDSCISGCDNCDYANITLPCEFCWVMDNYNVARKE
mgnify:FL=1